MKKNEITKNAKSIVSAFALVLVAISLVFFSGCGSDDEGGVDPVVGTWVVTSATLNDATPEAVPAQYTGGTETVLPAGTNVTPIFVGIVATAGPCDNPANTAIQLTEDKKMLYVCINETTDPDETGTWLLSNDGSTLSIAIQTSTPGLPPTVTLSFSPFTATATTLSGTIDNFVFFPSAENQTTGVQSVSIDVTFTKVS